MPKQAQANQPVHEGPPIQQQKPRPGLVPLDSRTIQQLLEDNCRILRIISEKQSLGRWEECEKLQRLVHKNLTYLAALADAQQRAAAQQQQRPGAVPQAIAGPGPKGSGGTGSAPREEKR